MSATRFIVVKEAYGWAVRLDNGMMSPFWSRDLALQHANNCASLLRRHGEQADVMIQDGAFAK